MASLGLDDLQQRGADIDALATLARTDKLACGTRLKQLGFSTVGARSRLTTLLLQHIAECVHPAPTPSRPTAPSQSRPPPPLPAPPSPPPPSGSSAPGHHTTLPHDLHYFQVMHKYVNVRATPDIAARILAMHFAGEVVVTDNEQHGWVRPVQPYGSAAGWLLIDGHKIGLGQLLHRLSAAEAEQCGPLSGMSAALRESNKTYLNFLVRPPKPAAAAGPLPEGVSGPVSRFKVARPAIRVHAQPDRHSAVVDLCMQGELVWSGTAPDGKAASPRHRPAGGGHFAAGGGPADPRSRPGTSDWYRLADPDGWVHHLCPAGFEQLVVDGSRHHGRPERELEALDLFTQARVAVRETYGEGSRLKLPALFEGWEAEALAWTVGAESNPQIWVS